MVLLRVIALCLFMLPALASHGATERENSPMSIGVATMLDDGTIQLRLSGAGTGMQVDSLLEYGVDHPDYQEILDHVGPMAPGDSKSVRPWEEPPADGDSSSQ